MPRLWRWVGGVLTVVIVMIAAGGAWMANYMPLRRSTTGIAPNGCIRESAEVMLPGREAETRILELTCGEVGDIAQWYVSLRNDGPLPVTVIDLLGRPGPYPPFGTIEVRMYDLDLHFGDAGLPETFDDFEPFRPLTLRPGHEGYMFGFRATVERCDGGGFRAVPQATFEVFGIERHDPLWAPYQLAINCLPTQR